MTVAVPALADDVAKVLLQVAAHHPQSRAVQLMCMEKWRQVCWACELCLGEALPWAQPVRQDTRSDITAAMHQALARFPSEELRVAAFRVFARIQGLQDLLNEIADQPNAFQAVLTELHSGWHKGPLVWSWCDDSAR